LRGTGFLDPPPRVDSAVPRPAGPVVFAPTLLRIVIHVVSCDGSKGAVYWPVALLTILVSMPLLSGFGIPGLWARRRVEEMV
jgi:hypothetical protein